LAGSQQPESEVETVVSKRIVREAAKTNPAVSPTATP